jgi:putative Mg2+ transporter-C (MgtC) family protein
MQFMAGNWVEQFQIAAHVVVATLLGAAVGFERELSRKPAGLRTHALLAAAAALLIGLTDPLASHFAAESLPDVLRVDPTRVVEAIVTGVAFLGAGTIFRHAGADVIEGLTTAASLLLVAAVAICVALGELLLAFIVTGLTLALLRLMHRIEKR